MEEYGLYHYVTFFAIVIFALWLDLFLHKNNSELSFKSAVLWSIFWILVGLLFGLYIYLSYGSEDGYKYLTGYLLEKSLAVDNLFVFIAIFTSFSIPTIHQHKILFYGIIGAIIFRIIFITLGTFILTFGDWVLILFGLIIIFTAYRMMVSIFKGKEHSEEDYSHHWSIEFISKIMPVYPQLADGKFFIKPEKIGHTKSISDPTKWHMTPLFLALICVEVADIMFAFDSVPAIISITNKPYLIITSNIFAILGLRSLYFMLSTSLEHVKHLDKAVVALLFFIGLKIIGESLGVLHIDPSFSLVITLVILSVGIIASFIPLPTRK